MRTLAKSFSVLALFGVLLVAGQQAQAGLLIDPYVGYGGGTFTTSPASGTEEKINLTGTTFGARLGFTVPFFFMALDYGITNGSADGWGSKGDSTIQNHLYGLMGVKLPFIRVYAGYAFMDTFKIQATGGDTTYSGTAIKGGVGFTGIPFISLNLEYIMNTYTKFSSSALSQDIPGAAVSKASSDAVVFSLSVPFDI